MNDRASQDPDIILSGLDGANPLAFLAALGALRTLTRAWPDRSIGLGWTVDTGAWRPFLRLRPAAAANHIVDAIRAAMPADDDLFDTDLLSGSEDLSPKNKKGEPKWRDKLRFPRELFAQRALACAREAVWDRRDRVDCFAAWACDASVDQVDGTAVARRTRFDFTAGNQAFIGMVRELCSSVGPDEIRNALFGHWKYLPGVVSMRWDPVDEARQYALQAVDPQDGAKNPILSVPGANLLALAAVPFFPVVPRGSAAEQPGFDRSADGRSFRWPIWRPALSADVVRSILCLEDLTRTPLPRTTLRARGIEVVFRSWIVQPSGRYRNFTPAEAV